MKLFLFASLLASVAHASVIVNLDPSGERAAIILQDKFTNPQQIDNIDALTLFQALRTPAQTNGGTTQKNLLSLDQKLSVECTSATGGLSFASCLIMLGKNPSALICYDERKIRYQVFGQDATALNRLFSPNQGEIFAMQSKDKKLSILSTPSQFLLEAHDPLQKAPGDIYDPPECQH